MPWYIKNQTTVNCIIDEITDLTSNGTNECLSDESLRDDTVQAVVDEPYVGFEVPVNEQDSDDSSEAEDFGFSYYGIKVSDEEDSDTIKSADDVQSEVTVKQNNSGSSDGQRNSSRYFFFSQRNFVKLFEIWL